jgi:hypothetical protein
MQELLEEPEQKDSQMGARVDVWMSRRLVFKSNLLQPLSHHVRWSTGAQENCHALGQRWEDGAPTRHRHRHKAVHETASYSGRNMCLGVAGSSDDDVATAGLCCSLGFSRLLVLLSRPVSDTLPRSPIVSRGLGRR